MTKRLLVFLFSFASALGSAAELSLFARDLRAGDRVSFTTEFGRSLLATRDQSSNASVHFVRGGLEACDLRILGVRKNLKLTSKMHWVVEPLAALKSDSRPGSSSFALKIANKNPRLAASPDIYGYLRCQDRLSFADLRAMGVHVEPSRSAKRTAGL